MRSGLNAPLLDVIDALPYAGAMCLHLDQSRVGGMGMDEAD